MRLPLIFFIFAVFTPLISCWNCGSGFISEKISWLISAPSSDKDYVDKCCQAHDMHYDHWCAGHGFVNYNEADYMFEKCLEKSKSKWTRNAVRPLFGFAVNLNSWYQKTFGGFCDK